MRHMNLSPQCILTVGKLTLDIPCAAALLTGFEPSVSGSVSGLFSSTALDWTNFGLLTRLFVQTLTD